MTDSTRIPPLTTSTPAIRYWVVSTDQWRSLQVVTVGDVRRSSSAIAARSRNPHAIRAGEYVNQSRSYIIDYL